MLFCERYATPDSRVSRDRSASTGTGASGSSSSRARSLSCRTRIGASPALRWLRWPDCCGLHDAARGFDPHGFSWNDSLADPAGGTLICHNDVEPSNVVFRDGIAVALLDFEFAAPGRPAYDLAHLARLCVPIEDDFDQNRIGWRPADRPARLRLVADAYGLDQEGRKELLTAMNDALARIEATARRSIGTGDPNTLAMMNRTGGIEKYNRRRRWWSAHHDQFAAALL